MVSLEDIFPQYVCINCVGKLRDFKSFKDQCTTHKELLERAYANRQIFSKEVNTNGIEPDVDVDCKPIVRNGTIIDEFGSPRTGGVERSADTLSTGEPSAVSPGGGSSSSVKEPSSWVTIKEEEEASQDGIEDPLALDDSEAETFPSASEWVANPGKAAFDFYEIQHTLKGESQVERSADALSTGEPSAVPPMGGSSPPVREPNGWENLKIKQEKPEVETFSEALSTGEPSAVLPREENSYPSVKEPNSWENLTIKQEEEASQDGIEDPLALDDSEDETFPCASGWEVDPEKVDLGIREIQHTTKEESQDSGNSHDASGSIEKEGEVKRKIFQCSECGKEYTFLKSYRHHLHTHKIEKIFQCIHCDKRFTYNKALVRHLICHSDESLGCDTCGKTFKSKQRLKVHLLHHGDRSFKCSFCGKGFCTSSSLNEHERRHAKGNNHVCDICEKVFDNTFLFRRHKYGHKYVKNRPRKCECSVCGMKCLVPSHLVIHMRSHTKERPFSCPRCAACFSRKQSLERHVRSQHTEGGLAPVQCHECGKRYADVKNLEQHKKTFHMGLKEFKCHHCGQEFTQRHSLKKHVERKHSLKG